MLWWKDCILVVDMSNKDEYDFYIISCPGGLLKFDITVCKANVLRYIWRISEDLENSRKLMLWWKNLILVVDISNKDEYHFYIISCPGGYWNLILWFATLMYSDIFGVFLTNLENYRKLNLWWEDWTLAADMSNKNENNFYIISCPGGMLTLDIIIREANVLTYI